MIRKSFHYWLAMWLLGPACALALEVGEIQVNSALNQLFDARIPLPMLTPEELGKITAKLAGPPMFKEFGLERTPALANLVFAIEYNAEGQVYVRVVSTQPIREPSLALLLEFGWPRGKTFREFTVFLDPVQRLVNRPGGRTKTVMEPPTSVGYGPESAAAPGPDSKPDSKPDSESPPPPAVAAAPETDTPPVEPAMPSADATVPLPPLPVKTYAPGDSYTVAPGDGLWGIALKVRPDPGITREQMMQALFQANPQAFSKAGIPGLKMGATLRMPRLREIADWTGSPVARQLAEKDEPVALTDAAKPEAKPVPADSVKATPDQPVAFPLPPAATPEPVAAAPLPEPIKPAPPAETQATALWLELWDFPSLDKEGWREVPGWLEAATPPLGLDAYKPELAGTTPEPAPVVAAPEPAPEPLARPEPAPEPAASLEPASEPAPVVATLEPAPPVMASEPAIAEPEPAAAAVVVEEEASTPILEPVSATPLLFLAIAEMMAAATQIPTAVPGPVILPAVVSTTAESAETATVMTDTPPLVASPVAELIGQVIEPAPAELAHQPVLEPPPVAETGRPSVVEVASLVADPLPVIEAVESPSVELASPPVESSPAVEPVAATAEPVTPAAEPPPTAPVKPATPVVMPYKGGDAYGPVSANERLWNIATKVRPDPAIGKDAMMRALFAVNPQAFSQSGNMNSLKVGAMLRVPTLQEIADLAGSKVARQLLEQQPATTGEAVPAN